MFVSGMLRVVPVSEDYVDSCGKALLCMASVRSINMRIASFIVHWLSQAECTCVARCPIMLYESTRAVEHIQVCAKVYYQSCFVQ